jgi:integrase
MYRVILLEAFFMRGSSRSPRTPSLRRHKPSQRGVVTLNGVDLYLGPWPRSCRKPPPETQAAYDRTIAEWLANGRRAVPTAGSERPAGVTLNELILAFYRHAEIYYRRPDGMPTEELKEYRYSLRPLRELYGTLPVAEFTPLKLKAVRQRMIDAGWCRTLVNRRVGRIVHMVKWGVAEELATESVYNALSTVGGLEKGRTAARESEPVLPVPEEHVLAVLPYLSPPVRAMAQLQLYTGMRPGEVRVMRGCDLDVSGAVWLYRPPQHKTAHKGKQRVIAIGPRGQEVIRPFLKLDTQAFLFSPREAMDQFRAERRAKRKTKVYPSQQYRRKRKPKKQPGDHYSASAYNCAIAKACIKAGVPHFHPHRIRHTHATEVRRRFGLEAAQVALGHAQANVTEVYAERDLALAVKVAQQIG